MSALGDSLRSSTEAHTLARAAAPVAGPTDSGDAASAATPAMVWLEVDGDMPQHAGAVPTDLHPFAALDDGSPDDVLGASFRGTLRSGGGQNFSFQDLVGGGWLEQLREAAQVHGAGMRHRFLFLLQLLTCNSMAYFYEHLSARNVVYLALSSLVFVCSWFSLEPGSLGWALGLVYVAAATSQCGALEPWWTATLAIAAHCVFDLAGPSAQRVLWIVLAVVAAISEACWWPSAEFLIENSFHKWVVHFSTYYAVVIDLWLWPHLLLMDPSKWRVVQEIEKEPPETQQAITEVGAGIAVLVLLPVAACAMLLCIVIWHRSPRLCMGFVVAYIGLAGLLLLFRNAEPETLISVGQVPIGIIFVALTRSQLTEAFGDCCTWRAQAVLLASLLALKTALELRAPEELQSCAMAAGVIIFQLMCKQWLCAQCVGVHLGLPHCFKAAAWAPRRSAFLVGRAEVYDRRLLLER